MIKVKNEDLITLKRILGDIYMENGNVEEVVLLSEVVDKIISSIQRNIINLSECDGMKKN